MANENIASPGATTTKPQSKAASVFDDDGVHMTIFTQPAVARVTAALQAIETLSGILLNLHNEADWEEAVPPVHSLDTRGILNAISVCSSFANDHLDGGGLTSHYTVALEKDDAGFEQIQHLANQARDLQRTKRDKRRLEVLNGMSI